MKLGPSPPRSVYVHVPFCRHRCGYCDFTLVAGRDELFDDYLRALALELDATVPEAIEVDTLFLGGGTPTHPPTEELERLLALLRSRFRTHPETEFSVEANPVDVTDEKVALLAEAGVNRVSLGAQSFDEHVLRTLERDHRRDDVIAAVERLKAAIGNVAVDLIFGVPGQSLALWERTLDEAVALPIAHVSTYGLTIEKGTAFWGRREKGTLVPLPDDVERAMYEAAMDRLPAAGFAQYEISNFARPGFRCRHNEVYWRGGDYLAFGPGAARYVGGVRETNHRSVTGWIKHTLAGETAIGDRERLAPEDRARERLAIGLRLVEGVDRERFREETGFDVDALAGPAIERHRDAGLLERSPTHLRLTPEGRCLADSVVVDVL